MKRTFKKVKNCNINPILYDFYLRLKQTLDAHIVHRRKRPSDNCIEIVFYNNLYTLLHGRLNSLKEAEAWGYWVICRPQSKRNHTFYDNHKVYQLYLSPVHPKKRNEAKHLAASVEIPFEPVITSIPRVRKQKNTTKICISQKKAVILHAKLSDMQHCE